MSRARRILTSLLCGAIVAGCTAPSSPGASGDDHDEPAPFVSLSAEAYDAAGITVAPVELHAPTTAIKVTGTLSYDERRMAIATARVGGRITRVVADYGQVVSAGDALAWIDSPELGAAQAEYRRAASMTALRAAELERAKLLAGGDAISRGELLRREADWRAAQADRESAEQRLHILGLSQTDVAALADASAEADHVYPVRTPIAGRVTERNAVPGRVVSAEDELFTVAELGSLWLFLQVFEKDLPLVREGAEVTLTCESHPEHRFRGTIDFLGQVLDPHSRTVKARAVIDNRAGKLKPGMFVYARIESRDDERGLAPRLAVPAAAIANVEGRDVVFVRTGERAFEPRAIESGQIGEEWVEIRSGLSEGESIAISGVFTLKSELLAGGLEEHHH